MMMFFGMILIPCAAIAITWGCCELYGNYTEFNNGRVGACTGNYYGHTAKLKWKSIKSLYPLNRARWRYRPITNAWGNKVRCLLFNAGDQWEDSGYYGYKNSDQIVRVQLSLIDFIKFRLKSKFTKEQDLGTELILQTSQKDIDKIRQSAERELDKAQVLMENLLNDTKDKKSH